MNQTILITGAGSGLGRSLGISLAQQGHTILVTDVDETRAQSVAGEIVAAGGTATAHRLDVTSEADAQRLLDEHGPVGVLINNAGLQHVAPLDEFPVAKWDLLIDVMVKGTFLMTRAALPGMRASGFGRIIHIGSIHSLVASPYKSAYTAAKHSLIGFSKVLALETAGTDITSNVICPAYIRTPLVDAQIGDQARARGISEQQVIDDVMLAPMPKKAFISCEEVAGAVGYLISPLARNVTGQAITIDGGWTAQ
ncbi:D-beta-hydroxybutyrate dehydrogenase [Novipirellula galeiformis]|uniref:D-beta-hydroxybutyrate dehydrogenase n=1 Tax=Novipirellula galeiformis TaxID=2528004 RepID=A0A5C6C3A9_9BACT|nr:3-hydroxybutyrate dehydrogenase [Novipirellula galeiformis]TWU17764.1 D-beta-hydroxybutyrate dehydrogenase [Novipirellula galeiformis]